MRKLYIIAASALLVMGAVSCKKNSDVQDPESKEGKVKVVFNASSKEGSEKTSLSGSSVLWSEGDQVMIYAGDEDYDGNVFDITEGWGTTAGIFEGWLQESATAPYYAVYPASEYAGIDDEFIYYYIPTEQAYVENSFATDVAPMIAYSASDKALSFKNQCAFIKLQLTGEGTIETMEITSEINSICGSFQVSKTNPEGPSEESGTEQEISILEIEGTELDNTNAINVIIAVAPNDFADDDLTLTMTSTDGGEFSTKLGGFNLSRSYGKSVEVENIAFSIFGRGEASRNIEGGGTTKVKWVQLWENGPKWAEYNVGSDTNHDYNAYYTWGGSYKNGSSIAWQDDHYKERGDLKWNEDPTKATDTATKLWGSNWRMPTYEEFWDLSNNLYTTSEWVANYNGTDKAGWVFTGKDDYSKNSVFFPVAGKCISTGVGFVGSNGGYWSSIDNIQDTAYDFIFNSQDMGTTAESYSIGYSVRAILYEEE